MPWSQDACLLTPTVFFLTARLHHHMCHDYWTRRWQDTKTIYSISSCVYIFIEWSRLLQVIQVETCSHIDLQELLPLLHWYNSGEGLPSLACKPNKCPLVNCFSKNITTYSKLQFVCKTFYEHKCVQKSYNMPINMMCHPYLFFHPGDKEALIYKSCKCK